jgi:acetyl esterase/lipase
MGGCAASAQSAVTDVTVTPSTVTTSEAPVPSLPASTEPSAPVVSSSASGSQAPLPTALPGQAMTAEYLPGVRAVVNVPAKEGPNPLLVIIPGGGWKSSDPGYMGPLISAFDSWGLTVVTLSYSGTEAGATFPQPVEELTCGVRWASAVAAAAGRPASTVNVLGHSAGAHLGSLVALSGDAFAQSCPWPAVHIDTFIGLAGLYDPLGAASVPAAAALTALFGAAPAEDPETWALGDPMTWVEKGVPDGLSIFLLHGVDDEVLPVEESRTFAAALQAAGADVEMVDWSDGHWGVIDPTTVVPPLHTWLMAQAAP